MRDRIIVLAICLVVLSIEIVPVCSQPNGMAIIAVRTTAVESLGHVGVGFQNDDGTWTIGAVENSRGSPVVLDQKGLMGTEIGASDGQSPFSDNDAWVEQNIDLKDAEAKFRSLGYDGIKIIQVGDPNPGNANSVIKDLPKRGYNVVTNNCLSATIDVLNAFGVKNLPLQIAHVAPNDYYANVQGEEYLWDSSKDTYTDIITGSALADNPSTNDEETSSTSVKSSSLSIKEQIAASKARLANQERQNFTSQINPSETDIITGSALTDNPSTDDEETSSTSAKSSSLSIKEQIAASKARLANQERQNFTSQVNPSEVTLTLYVREARDSSSDSNLLIKGAEVKCEDGLGTDSEHTTDSNGRVIITGVSGRWHLRVIAFGHIPVDDVLEVVEDDLTYTIRLSKMQEQDSKHSAKISTKTKSSTNGSKNSIVGKWMVYFDWRCMGNAKDPMTINFKADGTLIYDDGDTGNWEQYGDTIRWYHNPEYESYGSSSKCWPTCEGTIKTNAMDGTMVCKNPPQIGHDATGCWEAARVG